MNKIDVSQSSVLHFLHPCLTVLATSMDDKKNPNIITLAWAMPTSFDPLSVIISVGRARYSHDLIQESGEFVINVPSQELLDEVEFCGSKSGSEIDKFEETGLTPERSEEVEVPRIRECVAHLECEVVDHLRTGDHTIFVGKIVAASVDQEVFDEGMGTFDLDRFRPIFHVGGSRFVTSGEKLT